jgi:hypothetical protein
MSSLSTVAKRSVAAGLAAAPVKGLAKRVGKAAGRVRRFGAFMRKRVDRAGERARRHQGKLAAAAGFAGAYAGASAGKGSKATKRKKRNQR